MTPFGWAARATGLPGAMAAMANMMAGNPLDIGISADEAARKNLKRRVTEESHKPYGSSRSQDDALKARLAEVGQASVTPKVDASQVDAFGAKAEENGEKAKQALNVTFSPKVDNSSLERTANLLDAISGKISAVNGGLSGLRSNAATTVGGLGKVQRGRFSFGGIQGE